MYFKCIVSLYQAIKLLTFKLYIMTFTKLEQAILNGLDTFELAFEDCDIEMLEYEIREQTGLRIDAKVLRGAISSLIKKEIVTADEGLIYRIDQ